MAGPIEFVRTRTAAEHLHASLVCDYIDLPLLCHCINFMNLAIALPLHQLGCCSAADQLGGCCVATSQVSRPRLSSNVMLSRSLAANKQLQNRATHWQMAPPVAKIWRYGRAAQQLL